MVPATWQKSPPRGPLGRALTGGLVTIGAALFVLGRIGASTGWVYASFDMHHVIAQVGRVTLLLIGLMR